MICTQITTFNVNGDAHIYKTDLSVNEEAKERLLESGVVNLHPDFQYQTIEGFGGAMTESSAYLFSKMDSENRKRALACYFGAEGIRTRFIRTHIDSCDFSLSEYTAVEDPMADPGLATFSLRRDRQYIIPMLKEAISMSREPLSVLLSPWSPPACWKTPANLGQNDLAVYGAFGIRPPSGDKPERSFGGSLKPEYYSSWAKYMMRYVREYLEEGIPVTMLSVQNEAMASTIWDSCVWTAEQEKTFLRDYLHPEIKAAGLDGKIELFVWDHNKERMLERAGELFDDVTGGMIAGIAFHWYSGDHFEAIRMFKEKYPGKVLMLSECCEIHAPGESGMNMPFLPPSYKTPGSLDHKDAIHYAHDIIGNLNEGMQRWLDWNLILDEKGGPRHVRGGCTAGLIAKEDGTFRTSLIYHYIAHFSGYIRPGAKRIGFSRYTDEFEMTAAKNSDGQIVAVFLNKNPEDTGCEIRIEGKVIHLKLPAGTISTVLIQ